MKKYATMLLSAMLFALPLVSTAYNKTENKCFSSLFAGMISIDNKSFELAKGYVKEGVELSQKTENDRLKGYAYLSLGLVYQKTFPQAKDIPIRQKHLDNAYQYLKIYSQKSNSDGFFVNILTNLIEDRNFQVTNQEFVQFCDILKDEQSGYLATLKLFLMRNLTSSLNQTETQKQSKLVGDFLYRSGSDNILKARNHANTALSAKNIINSDSWRKAVDYNLNKSLEYYNSSQIINNGIAIPFQSPEIYALEEAVKQNNSTNSKPIQPTQQYVNDIEADKEGLVKMSPPTCPNTPWACIEISASAVKFSVICLSTERSGDFKYEFLNMANTDVKISETNFNDYTMSQAFEAVKEYRRMATEDYKLPNEQIFIAFSSGLGDVARKNNKMIAIEALQKQIREAAFTTHNVEILSVAEEARLTLLGIVTQDVRKELYVSGILDIGTGNVKGGFCVNNNCSPANFRSFNSSWALRNIGSQLTKSPDLSTPERAQRFADEVSNFVRNQPLTEISNQLMSTGILNKKQVFLGGGIFWAIPALLYPDRVFEKEETYIKLTLNDVLDFKRKVINDFARYADPQGYTEKSSAGLRDVTTKFIQEKAIIGAVLAEEIIRNIEKSPVKKTYYYSKYSVVGWPTGYIINRIAED